MRRVVRASTRAPGPPETLWPRQGRPRRCGSRLSGSGGGPWGGSGRGYAWRRAVVQAVEERPRDRRPKLVAGVEECGAHDVAEVGVTHEVDAELVHHVRAWLDQHRRDAGPTQALALMFHLPACSLAYQVSHTEQAEVPTRHGRDDDRQVKVAPAEDICIGGRPDTTVDVGPIADADRTEVSRNRA